MKTKISLENFPVEHITLFNDSILCIQKVEVSSLQLDALLKVTHDKPETMNSHYIQSFYRDLSLQPYIVLKISDEVNNKLNGRDIINTTVRFNKYDDYMNLINLKDEFDIENVKNDFKFDNKQSHLTNSNIKYKLHFYSIHSYTFLVASYD